MPELPELMPQEATSTIVDAASTDKGPEFKVFSEWKGDMGSGDDTTDYKSYANYLRKSYIDHGSYSTDVEVDIRQGMLTAMGHKGLVDVENQDELDMLFAPEEVSLDDRLKIIQKTYKSDTPEWERATQYLAFNNALNEGDLEANPDLQAKQKNLQILAAKTAYENYDEALERAVGSGIIPAARILGSDGSYKISVGGNADNLSLGEVVDRGMAEGGLSYSDAVSVKHYLDKPEGSKFSRYQLKQYHDTHQLLNTFLESSDKNVVSESVNRSRDLMVEIMMGKKVAQNTEKLRQEASTIGHYLSVSDKGLLENGQEPSEEQLYTAFEQLISAQAIVSPKLEMHEATDADVSKNVHVGLGYGSPLMHPAAMMNGTIFEATLEANKDLSEGQKKSLRDSRELRLANDFDRVNDMLVVSSAKEKWADALFEGRKEGLKDHKILDQFISDEDNYNDIGARAFSVVSKVPESMAQLMLGLGAMAGSEWAREEADRITEGNARLRSTARLFGYEHGLGQDVLEQIAPMISDVVTGKFLVKGGLKLATKMASSKLGGKITTKALSNKLVSRSLVAMAKDGPEALALKSAARGLLIKSTKQTSHKAAFEALEAFTKASAKSLISNASFGVVAGTRSAGMTYTSIYGQLQKEGKLSEEEMRDKALGAGMAAGVSTMLITTAFSMIGRGGVESALQQGLTKSQVRKVVARLADRKDIPEGMFRKLVAQNVDKAYRVATGASNFSPLKSYGAKVAKGFGDEAVEEGLDEFVNSYIGDAFTGEYTSLQDRFSQVFHSGLIGGIMGAGSPAITQAGQALGISEGQEQLKREVEEDFANRVAEDLKSNGAPASASVVLEILRGPARRNEKLVEAYNRVLDDGTPTEGTPTEVIPTEVIPTEVTPTEDQSEILFSQEEFDSFKNDLEDNTTPETVEEVIAEVLEETSQDASGTSTQLELDLLGDGQLADASDLSTSSPISQQEEASAVDAGVNLIETHKKENQDISSQEVPTEDNIPSEETDTAEPSDEQEFEVSPEDAEIMEALIESGYPPRVTSKNPSGFKVSKKEKGYYPSLSDMIATIINERYPVIPTKKPEGGKLFKGRNRAHFNVITGKRVTNSAVTGFLNEDGTGVFNNDPILMEEFLKEGIAVVVPPSFDGIKNKSIIVDKVSGRVKGVVTPNGKGQTSKANPKPDKVTNVYGPDMTYLINVATIAELISGDTDGTSLSEIDNFPTDRGGFQPASEVGEDATVGEYIRRVASFISGGLSIGGTQDQQDRAVGDMRKTLKGLLLRKDGRQLNPDYFDQAAQSLLAESMFFARAYSVRKTLLSDSGVASKITQNKKNNYVIPKSARSSVVKKFIGTTNLTNAQKKEIARRLLPRVGRISKADAKSPDAVIAQFVAKRILNEPLLKGGAMPSLKIMASRAASRSAQQENSRGVLEKDRASSALDPSALEVPDSESSPYTIDEDAKDIGFPTGRSGMSPSRQALNEAIDKSAFDVSSVLEDPNNQDLRDAVNDLLLNSVYDENHRSTVEGMSGSEAFGVLASWMSEGNLGNPEAFKFFNKLADGQIPAGMVLRSAFKLMGMSPRAIDGDPTKDSDYVDMVRESLSDSMGREVSQSETIDFIKSLDIVVRNNFSRSRVSKAKRKMAIKDNLKEIERLGLESGNPESVLNALAKIAKDPETSPSHKLVAELLLENPDLVGRVEFTIGNMNLDIAGRHSLQSNGVNTVFLNVQGHNGRGLENVLLEEYVHASLTDILHIPSENLTPEQATARANLETLRLAVVKNLSESGAEVSSSIMDSVSSIDEFVAGIMLSPTLQQEIKALGSMDSLTVGKGAKSGSLFRRIVDGLLRLFRKVTKSEATTYGDALADVIDLSKSSAQTHNSLSAKEIAKRNADEAVTKVEEAVEVADTVGVTADIGQDPTSQDSGLEVQDSDPVNSITQEESKQLTAINKELDAEGGTDRMTSEERLELPKIKEIMGRIRAIVPPEVTLVRDDSISSVAEMDGGVIKINISEIANLVRSMDTPSSKMLVEAIIDEELSHVASYNALTQAEVDSIANNLSLRQLGDIADNYYVNDPDKAQEAKDLLATTEFDPETEATVKEDILGMRRRLTEEHLRAMTQKVTRGYTTEEDHAFYRSNPSVMKVLFRYIGGVIKSMTTRRSLASGDNNQLDVAVNRMVAELRAIKAGYRVGPSRVSFDPKSPDKAMAMLEVMLGEKISVDPFQLFNEIAETDVMKSSLTLEEFDKLIKMTSPDAAEAAEAGDDLSDDESDTQGDKERLETINDDLLTLEGETLGDPFATLINDEEAARVVLADLPADLEALGVDQDTYEIIRDTVLSSANTDLNSISSQAGSVALFGDMPYESLTQAMNMVYVITDDAGNIIHDPRDIENVADRNPIPAVDFQERPIWETFSESIPVASAIRIPVNSTIAGMSTRGVLDSLRRGEQNGNQRFVASLYDSIRENVTAHVGLDFGTEGYVEYRSPLPSLAEIANSNGLNEDPLEQMTTTNVPANNIFDRYIASVIFASRTNDTLGESLQLELSMEGINDVSTEVIKTTLQSISQRLFDSLDAEYSRRQEIGARRIQLNDDRSALESQIRRAQAGTEAINVHALRESLGKLDNVEVRTDTLDPSGTFGEMRIAVGPEGARSTISFDIRAGGEVHVGLMVPDVRSERKGITAEPSAADPVFRLILDKKKIGVKKITTMGGGQGTSVANATTESSITSKQRQKEGLPPQQQQVIPMNGYLLWLVYGFDLANPESESNIRRDIMSSFNLNRYLKSNARRIAYEMFPEVMESFNQTFGRDFSYPSTEAYGIDLKIKSGEGPNGANMMLGSGTSKSVHHLSVDFDVHNNMLSDEDIDRLRDRILNDPAMDLEQLQKDADSFFEAGSRRDGPDNFHLNDAVANSRNKNFFRKFGQGYDYELDLTDGSAHLAHLQRLAKLMQRKKKAEVASTERSKVAESKLKQGGSQASEALQTSLSGPPIPASSIDFTNFINTLEIPIYKSGAYQPPKSRLMRAFKGDIDPRITALNNNRAAFMRAAKRISSAYKNRLDFLTNEAFNGDPDESQRLLLERAIGDSRGVVIPQDELTRIENKYDEELKRIANDDSLSQEEVKALQNEASEAKKRDIIVAENQISEGLVTARNEALAELEEVSPELAQHIRDIRSKLIIPLSTYIRDNYGLNDELKAHFDSQMEIYITRSYRMFSEAGYAKRVRRDEEYEPVRQAAIEFFHQDFVDKKVAQLKEDQGLSDSEATEIAIRERDRPSPDGRSKGQVMLDEFIENYGNTGTGVSIDSQSGSYRMLADNIKNKKDIPEPLRDLLGERGSDGTVDNILRTFTTVASMSANQAFLSHVATMGRTEGFLVTEEEYLRDKKEGTNLYTGWDLIRKGAVISGDPLNGLYAPPEMIQGFLQTFDKSVSKEVQSTASAVVAKVGEVARKATGWSMAAKTLGNVGFYFRNVLSNMIFFGPSQGFFNMKSMGLSAFTHLKDTLKDPDRLDGYLFELTALGVVGDEIRSNIMQELMTGQTTPDQVSAEIESMLSKLGKGAKVVSGTKKTIDTVYETAANMAAAVDAFYKIAYFEHELDILKKSREWSQANDVGPEGSMSDTELKMMARDKVLATAQSASQAPPVVRSLASGEFGILFAPFLRFKAEVPRIVINTYKLGLEEASSPNPVIQKRGRKRLISMTSMLTITSAILPAVLAKLAGVGEDEDEALRKTVPTYLRGHTFFYFRSGEDQSLKSVDLTYINPYALLIDPIMRSVEGFRRGGVGDGVGNLLTGLVFNQYLDDQILASAVASVKENRDATTGRPIWEETTDSFGEKFVKGGVHMLGEAYSIDVAKRAISAYKASRAIRVEGEEAPIEESPLGLLLAGALPFKVHTVDLEQQLTRYLRERKEEYDNISLNKYKAYSSKPLSEQDIMDLYNREVSSRKKLNNDVAQTFRGFQGLGMSPKKIYEMSTSKRLLTKRRTKNIFLGVMDKPAITPKFAKGIHDNLGEAGLQRLKVLFRESIKYNKFIELDEGAVKPSPKIPVE